MPGPEHTLRNVRTRSGSRASCASSVPRIVIPPRLPRAGAVVSRRTWMASYVERGAPEVRPRSARRAPPRPGRPSWRSGGTPWADPPPRAPQLPRWSAPGTRARRGGRASRRGWRDQRWSGPAPGTHRRRRRGPVAEAVRQAHVFGVRRAAGAQFCTPVALETRLRSLLGRSADHRDARRASRGAGPPEPCRGRTRSAWGLRNCALGAHGARRLGRGGPGAGACRTVPPETAKPPVARRLLHGVAWIRRASVRAAPR